MSQYLLTAPLKTTAPDVYSKLMSQRVFEFVIIVPYFEEYKDVTFYVSADHMQDAIEQAQRIFNCHMNDVICIHELVAEKGPGIDY